MGSHSTNLDYSLQQIPYPCDDPSYEFSNSSDVLEEVHVTPNPPARRIQRTSSHLQPAVTPVANPNDVGALLSKPLISVNAIDHPDPRVNLFEQNLVYDDLPGSYTNEAIGSYFSDALDTEVNHTLADAWKFNPIAVSVRDAQETALDSSSVRAHGLRNEVLPWVKDTSGSRMQTQLAEKRADEIIVQKSLRYQHYDELHDESLSTIENARELAKVLDDFYGLNVEEPDPTNPYDYRHLRQHLLASGSSNSQPLEPHGAGDMNGGTQSDAAMFEAGGSDDAAIFEYLILDTEPTNEAGDLYFQIESLMEAHTLAPATPDTPTPAPKIRVLPAVVVPQKRKNEGASEGEGRKLRRSARLGCRV